MTKTGELGIFQRGDRSEIGVFKDRPLDNDYALNTVDICPVGALTSKDFRFRQRVWYLKSAPSLCTGCSTGCHIFADYNEEGLWRVRPRVNPKINGHWICDKGRELYQNSNRTKRLMRAQKGTGAAFQSLSSFKALSEIRSGMFCRPEDLAPEDIALVLTGQYTNEEYLALRDLFSKGGERVAEKAEEEAQQQSAAEGAVQPQTAGGAHNADEGGGAVSANQRAGLKEVCAGGGKRAQNRRRTVSRQAGRKTRMGRAGRITRRRLPA